MGKKNKPKKLSHFPNERSFNKEIRIKKFKPRNELQKWHWECLSQHYHTFVLGRVGTGKTYVTVYKAVQMLNNDDIKRIIVFRANVSADEDIGFFKGTEAEKVQPYLECMLQPMREITSDEKVEQWLEEGKIKLGNIGTTRGMTYHDSFILVDEMQNLSPSQLELLGTRIGDSSKIVFMGDGRQCDLPADKKSAIEDIDRFKNCRDIGFVEYQSKHIVRGQAVKIFESCYNDNSKWEGAYAKEMQRQYDIYDMEE